MARGGANIRPNRLLYQSIQIVPEVGLKQSFYRGPHAINDRPHISRLVFRRPLKLFEGCQDCSALGVAEHDHKSRAEPLSGEFNAANLRRGNDISGNANNKQVSQALIKHDLRRNARIGTSENDRKWLLTLRQFGAPAVAEKGPG